MQSENLQLSLLLSLTAILDLDCMFFISSALIYFLWKNKATRTTKSLLSNITQSSKLFIDTGHFTSVMASLSKSRWQNGKERSNQSINNGDMDDKSKFSVSEGVLQRSWASNKYGCLFDSKFYWLPEWETLSIF